MHGTCGEISGFLFKHACKREAVDTCADCDKPICGRHAKKSNEGGVLCVLCTKSQLDKSAPAQPAQGRRHRSRWDDDHDWHDDPYFYGETWYHGYGSYRRGSWGHQHYHAGHYDGDDFSEADGAAFANQGDEAYEQDMGGS